MLQYDYYYIIINIKTNFYKTRTTSHCHPKFCFFVGAPLIETLVAQESSEDEGDDCSRSDELQNDGVILELRQVRCMKPAAVKAQGITTAQK